MVPVEADPIRSLVLGLGRILPVGKRRTFIAPDSDNRRTRRRHFHRERSNRWGDDVIVEQRRSHSNPRFPNLSYAVPETRGVYSGLA